MTSVKPDQPETGSPATPSTPAPGYITGIADGNLAQDVKLRDFLFGIGVVFRLPKLTKKDREREAAAIEAKKFKIRIPVRAIATVLAPVVIGLAGYYAYQQWSGDPMPPAVVGTWSSDDGRYAGRSFWLNAQSVAFQNGKLASEFSVHPIKKLRVSQVADTTYLAINYEQDGSPITFSIKYHEHPVPEIRMVNQPNVGWERTGNAPAVMQ